MKQFLATKLTIEQCAQRLHNTIDPIPTPEERLNTAPNTTGHLTRCPMLDREQPGLAILLAHDQLSVQSRTAHFNLRSVLHKVAMVMAQMQLQLSVQPVLDDCSQHHTGHSSS